LCVNDLCAVICELRKLEQNNTGFGGGKKRNKSSQEEEARWAAGHHQIKSPLMYLSCLANKIHNI